MLRPWLAGSLVAAALVALLPSGATARLGASNFPPSQGLKLIEKDAPSWVGEPAAVVSVQTITSKRFGSVKNRFAHWVTWERPWRDSGKGRFLILRVKNVPAACRYFLSLVDPKDRTGLRQKCNRLPANDLSVYGGVSYTLVYREIRSRDHRWRVHAGDDNPLRGTTGRQISEYLDRGLLPGHYDVRIQVKVGLAPHPLFDFIVATKEWIDWIKTPSEVVGGPIGWALEEIRDELIKGIVGALRTTKSIYAFDVPAIMPNVRGKKPSQAIKLLKAFQLRPKLVKTTRPGTGVSTVIGQSESPGTWLLAGTEVTVAYAAYGPSPPAVSFTGDWRVQFTTNPSTVYQSLPGTYTFRHSGSTVCGRYDFSGGGKVTANVSGRTLTGSSLDRDFGRSTFSMTLAADGQHWAGTWQRSTLSGRWRGTRVGGPTRPC